MLYSVFLDNNQLLGCIPEEVGEKNNIRQCEFTFHFRTGITFSK